MIGGQLIYIAKKQKATVGAESMKGKKEMEIRKPKFELGQKVVDKNGDVETVLGFNSYHFEDNEYWYDVSYDGGTHIKKESFLKPYSGKHEEKKKTVWDLKERDECYSLTICGNVYHGFWDGSSSSIEIRDTGGIFLNREEAEFEVERRKIETEMLRLGGRRNINIRNDNYYITYDHKTRNLAYLNRNWMHSQGIIFFDTYVDVDKAVKAIGEDRIKKYIFGVE